MKRLPRLTLSVVRFAASDVITASDWSYVPPVTTPMTTSSSPPSTPIIPYRPKPGQSDPDE